jgi:hypothetical protein
MNRSQVGVYLECPICKIYFHLPKRKYERYSLKGQDIFCCSVPCRFKYDNKLTVEAFWNNKTITSSGCWEWLGRCSPYGVVAEVRNLPFIDKAAHRLAYKLYHNKEIPKGLLVRHKCNNKPCINPSHLELGNYQDNSDDKVLSGNQAKGTKIGVSKLTEGKVKFIKNLLETKCYTNKQVAKLFNVDVSIIIRITSGKIWKHVK